MWSQAAVFLAVSIIMARGSGVILRGTHTVSPCYYHIYMQRILVFPGKNHFRRVRALGENQIDSVSLFSSEAFIVARLGYACLLIGGSFIARRPNGEPGRWCGDGREGLGERWGQKYREGRPWHPLVVGFETCKGQHWLSWGIMGPGKVGHPIACWKTCSQLLIQYSSHQAQVPISI